MKEVAGFSLIEMAIVLLIVGLLLGSLMMPLSHQAELRRYTTTQASLADIREAVLGYALANDALPCPATAASNGLAAASGGGCTVQHGFLPAVTIGLAGAQNQDHLLLDAWGSPIRYSVTNSDVDGDGNWDFTSPGEMRDVQIANLAPDLNVCTTASGSSASACADAASTLTASTPAVIYSLGGDRGTSSSPDQLENIGGTLGGGPSGRSYPVASDAVFVQRTYSESAADGFDDIVAWVSENTLYNMMVSAGRLP